MKNIWKNLNFPHVPYIPYMGTIRICPHIFTLSLISVANSVILNQNEIEFFGICLSAALVSDPGLGMNKNAERNSSSLQDFQLIPA